MSCRRTGVRIILFCIVSLLAVSVQASMPPPGSVSGALEWRLLGPFRGGWATMATGVPGQPDTFYIGTAGGGVWKTVDTVRTWTPLFNHQGAASIGAVAVAPSDPDVVYAGTGQVAARYDVAAGNGIYRSDNGGRSWVHVGLADSRHIGAILVDPHHPRTVLVAALGHYFDANHQRGVFRSTDGGRTWKQTLFINDATGVVDLAADPQHPEVVFAAAWQVRNYPWLSYFQPNAGPGSGLYRSTDGGVTWSRVRGHGWPKGDLGRIGIATGRGGVVYAILGDASASAKSGLYRSDDDGRTWRQVSHAGWMPNDYFSRITVDPHDANRIYAMGRSIRRSDDGGHTWTIIKGAPGGDDYHDLWIDPRDPARMITASDQGAVITVNGGRTWSSWYNQPTGQFYHLAADNRFPYWIYAGQQDSGTVGIASRSDYGSITYRDWHPVGGDERDYDLPYPGDPGIVFGSGLGGRVSRWDRRTGVVQNVTPWPVNSYGERPTQYRYHYTWITPIAFSARPPYALYLGSQVLFRSTDQGQHWDVISPPLNGLKAGAKHCDGDPTPRQAYDCGFGVIYAIAPSPRDNQDIWIGTDDGRIELTRDGGRHWRNITPKGLPIWSKIASLDVSRLAPGTAYAAVNRHRQGDFSPEVWRTHDYGRHWSEVSRGIPAHQFVTVVRADPVKAGLLYAGTNRGVYVSFDDGNHWRPLQRNLPTAWVRDLLVHGNDLIAATQGRAIWVLDDVTPLRQARAASIRAPAHLYRPAVAYRVRADENKDTPLPPETPQGQNPPAGAIFDYHLARDAHGPVTLSIYDAEGRLVRRYSSADKPAHLDAVRYFQKGWLRPGLPLSAKAGPHRFVWDLRYVRPAAVQYGYSIAAVWDSDTPVTPEGPLVLPGRYEAVLRVGGRDYRAPLTVRMDPREHVPRAVLAEALAFSQDVGHTLARIAADYRQVKAVRAELAAVDRQLAAHPEQAALRQAVQDLERRTRPLIQGSNGERTRNLRGMSDVLAGIATDVTGADRAPTKGQRQVLALYRRNLDAAEQIWQAIRTHALPSLNHRLQASGLPAIRPAEGSASQGVFEN